MLIRITEPVIIDGIDCFGGEVVEVETNVAYRVINSGRAVVATDTEEAVQAPKTRNKK